VDSSRSPHREKIAAHTRRLSGRPVSDKGVEHLASDNKDTAENDFHPSHDRHHEVKRRIARHLELKLTSLHDIVTRCKATAPERFTHQRG